MAFNTLQQPLHIFAQRLNFSRIACVTRLRCRPPDYHIFRGKNGQAPIRAYGVYAWGTSKHGLIPTSEIIDEEQMRLSNQSSSTFLSDTAAAMSVAKDTRSPVFDTPQRLNISKAFNCEREKHTTIQSYFCGHDNSAVIRSDGTCLIWGSNKNGQLGLDDIVERTIPTTLYPPQQLSSSLRFVNGVKHVSLGKTFSAAIDTDGNLHTFGYGGDFFSGMGWLGHGNGDASSVPKRVESLVEDGCEVKDVQVGENHMTVLTSEGEVLTG